MFPSVDLYTAHANAEQGNISLSISHCLPLHLTLSLVWALTREAIEQAKAIKEHEKA